MEENLRKISWLKILLAIVTVASFIVIYLALGKEGNRFTFPRLCLLIENLIPNLVSTLIVVIAIYFLFTKQGISSESNLINQIALKINGEHLPLEKNNLTKRDFRDYLYNGNEIIIVGLYLSTTINEHQPFFEELLKKGKKITFILLDPKDNAAIENSRRKFKARIRFEAEDVKKLIQIRIEQLMKIKQNLPKKYHRNIKIKLIDYPLGFGGYLVKTNYGQTKIFIKFYGYQTQEHNFLQISLSPKNGKVFNDFLDQFMNLEKDAKEIK